MSRKDIIDEMIINQHLLVHLTDIRTHDDYTFAHSLNVRLLSAMTGIKLGYPVGKLRELAVGSLSHGLRKMFVPLTILNKPGTLKNGYS
ncbi:MAG TPA: hypothetical protein VN631_02465 [Negativicutes bacterium]|nr:hypothetical protein [Negativicutes bacterium]